MMEENTLSSAIESILFAAERPVTIARLREVFGEEGPSEETLGQALASLKERYQSSSFGFELRDAQGGYHFTTKLENATYVQKFMAMKPFRLGRSALEALAIIAYRQPITRADIDRVRGIDSSHLLRVLIERGLVKMAGKADVPGRPVQYGTTPKFLEVVGLSSVSELPPLTELNELQGDTEDPIQAMERNLDKFLETTPTQQELSLQATEGLSEIEQLISKAEPAAAGEVYESADAAEIGKSNEEALVAFQEGYAGGQKKSRKKTVRFEELALDALPPLVAGPEGETPIN